MNLLYERWDATTLMVVSSLGIRKGWWMWRGETWLSEFKIDKNYVILGCVVWRTIFNNNSWDGETALRIYN